MNGLTAKRNPRGLKTTQAYMVRYRTRDITGRGWALDPSRKGKRDLLMSFHGMALSTVKGLVGLITLRRKDDGEFVRF